MPDRRQHRGPHPEDELLFARRLESPLREAVSDLSWLLSRGYASTSVIQLVGNRYSLKDRQRLAVARCAASDSALRRRALHEARPPDLLHQELWVDGYNVLTSLEAALSGGVILHARDGCFRDMASMHGSYRRVEETIPAITILGEILEQWQVAACRWFLDQPVSNSGRLKTMLQRIAEQYSWNWQTELVPNPDSVLGEASAIVASSDSVILDRALRWFNLARRAIELRIDHAWIVQL